jgi:hypothetical protein
LDELRWRVIFISDLPLKVGAGFYVTATLRWRQSGRDKNRGGDLRHISHEFPAKDGCHDMHGAGSP